MRKNKKDVIELTKETKTKLFEGLVRKPNQRAIICLNCYAQHVVHRYEANGLYTSIVYYTSCKPALLELLSEFINFDGYVPQCTWRCNPK